MTPEHVLLAAFWGASGAIGLAVGLGLAFRVEELHRRATWADDATSLGKAKVTAQWVYHRTDWRHIATWLVPRAAVAGAALGAALVVFATGLLVIFA